MAHALDGLAATDESDDESGSGDDSGLGGGGSSADALAGFDGLGTTGMASSSAAGDAQLARQLLAALNATAPVASTTPTPTATSADARANAFVVADVARQHGVDPVAAVAMMLVESGGNAGSVGDHGTSFGLFQLHEGGMLTAAGLTPQQAMDPRTNATVSINSLAHERAKGPNRTAGEIAAASQRPADPVGYARKVDAAMDRARALLGS
jgi:hypothetical protein